MNDVERVERTSRCPDPSPTKVKQLFGTASKCGRPECNETLYRLENGRPALNCRIAHIQASSPKGPRADPYMTCAEVNAFENLLLLCPYDAALIDDSWRDFPIEMLAAWKREQVEQASLLGTARQPTDDEISELITESRSRESLVLAVAVDLAKSVRRLRSEAERTRVEPQQILAEREQAERQLNRGFIGFDSETGERPRPQLSPQQERQFAARIDEALGRCRAQVMAAADAVVADAAGLAAVARAPTAEALGWVERAASAVVLRAGEWSDDLAPALDDLDAAASALADLAAGLAAHVPPAPVPPPPPEPTALEIFVEHCQEVHERAAPHHRVDHLPFDAELHAEVLELAPHCAAIPTIPSFMPLGISYNADLAAACLKNADDAEFLAAVDAAAGLLPEAAAAHHLRSLRFLATEQERPGRLDLVDAALRRLGDAALDRFASRDFWEGNSQHGSFVISCAATTHGAGNVTEALRQALANTELVEPMLIALAETVEELDSSTNQSTGIRRRFRPKGSRFDGLPASVPVEALCAAIEDRWAGGPSNRGPESERLAAEFRAGRCS